MLTSECAWRHLPPSFGVSVPTAHRRFMVWADAGVFDALHQEILDRLGAAGDIDWSAAILEAASVRAKRGIADRPQPGRSRQERLQDPRRIGCERDPAGHRCYCREHSRFGDAATDGRVDPEHPVGPRSAARETRQTTGGQRL